MRGYSAATPRIMSVTMPPSRWAATIREPPTGRTNAPETRCTPMLGHSIAPKGVVDVLFVQVIVRSETVPEQARADQ